MCEHEEREEHWFMKLLAFIAVVLVCAMGSFALGSPTASPLSTAHTQQAVADARARASSGHAIAKSLEELAGHQKLDPSVYAGVRAHAKIQESHAVELGKRHAELEAACTEYGDDHRECKRHHMLFAKEELAALQHGHKFKETYDQILNVAKPVASAMERFSRAGSHRPHKPIFPRPHHP